MSYLKILSLCGLLLLLGQGPAYGDPGRVAPETTHSSLAKAALFLAAGDYRRALEACQREIDDAQSAASYIHLTYVYQAIDAYLEHLLQKERWMAIEHLYLNLAYRDTEDLIEHAAMLRRNAGNRGKARIAVERMEQREQLDSLGAGAEDGEDASRCHGPPLSPDRLMAREESGWTLQTYSNPLMPSVSKHVPVARTQRLHHGPSTGSGLAETGEAFQLSRPTVCPALAAVLQSPRFRRRARP